MYCSTSVRITLLLCNGNPIHDNLLGLIDLNIKQHADQTQHRTNRYQIHDILEPPTVFHSVQIPEPPHHRHDHVLRENQREESQIDELGLLELDLELDQAEQVHQSDEDEEHGLRPLHLVRPDVVQEQRNDEHEVRRHQPDDLLRVEVGEGGNREGPRQQEAEPPEEGDRLAGGVVLREGFYLLDLWYEEEVGLVFCPARRGNKKSGRGGKSNVLVILI